MTTDKSPATAESETPIADAVEREAAITPSYVTKEDLGSFQGRIAQTVGQRFKDIREELRNDVSSVVRSILEEQKATAAKEQQYINELRQQGLDDDEINAVIQTNARREPQRQEPAKTTEQPQSQFNDGYSWSESERRALGRHVSGLLDGIGLEGVDVSDQRLWNGVDPSMTPDDAYKVVRDNARKILPSATPRSTEQRTTTQQAEKNPPAAPVSTQGAPSASAVAYASKAEAAMAFRNREIDSNQYKEALRNL